MGALGLVWLAAWWIYASAPESEEGVRALAQVSSPASSGGVSPPDSSRNGARGPLNSQATTRALPFAHSREGEVPRRIPIGKLLATRFVSFFTLSKVFMDPVWYFFVFWFPKYLAEVHHFSLKEIGWKGWIPYFTAAMGNIAGGLLTSWFLRAGLTTSVARKLSTAFFAVLMLSTIAAILTTSAPLAIALISLTTFGSPRYTANTLAFPADVFPK